MIRVWNRWFKHHSTDSNVTNPKDPARFIYMRELGTIRSLQNDSEDDAKANPWDNDGEKIS